MNQSFREIDAKWQKIWAQKETFKANEQSGKEKCYVLDMFPYPSGAGLHVGHPLGYIASDIYARYKRQQGFEVLHPMGYDAFGLPAEQYAIETGQHPAKTTEVNIRRYECQMKLLGISFDWSRSFRTSDPQYYKWTQWLFLKMFNAWYDKKADKARPIETLIKHFETNGTEGLFTAAHEKRAAFSAEDWQKMDEDTQQQHLLDYRLAYLADAEVNWCPALGTVLANDEVRDGRSERGGHPVEKKKMKQWFLRITAYADRLIQDLQDLDWSDAIKEVQKNWIGRSEGAAVNFAVQETSREIAVFTTRPDTIFGVTFLVLAPESKLVGELTTKAQAEEVSAYVTKASGKEAKERQANQKPEGVFTGAYALHPITKEKLPIWVSEYVLADYGSGAVMAVPGHDERDARFAQAYGLNIQQVVEPTNPLADGEIWSEKKGIIRNSDFLDGLTVEQAIPKAIAHLEKHQLGFKKIQYRLRDAGFSRQRYWGEPFPIVYKNGIPYPVAESELPVSLPEVEHYKSGPNGGSPLANVEQWVNQADGSQRETNTMPGNAGSSWYFLRFMDAHNPDAFVSKEKEAYWQQVDFYMGGAEHATGHLLYARFWQKVLFDLNLVSKNEPFRKLVNQGMILNNAYFAYRLVEDKNKFVTYEERQNFQTQKIPVPIEMVKDGVLDTEAFKKWRPDLKNATFILGADQLFRCGEELEKMSKSKHNVVNPDELIEQYGCDTFRMYEMFLGPIEQSKPWSTDGIEGVYKFLKKLNRLYFNEVGEAIFTEKPASEAAKKVLHKCIKAVNKDLERFSLNTCISHFMICVNELQKLKVSEKEILAPLAVLLAPFAPHLAEEYWEAFGNSNSIAFEPYPKHDERLLVSNEHLYPVSINGKMRTKMAFAKDAPKNEVEQAVLANEVVQKWMGDKPLRKFILVPGKIINLVI